MGGVAAPRFLTSSSSMGGVAAPRSSPVATQNPRRSAMEEEVWKDLSLGSLSHDRLPTPTLSLHYHHHSADAAAAPYVKPITLQDFLCGAFQDAAEDPPAGAPRRPSPGCVDSPGRRPASDAAAMSSAGDGNAVDRRKKRMIKNRESAARSRARKQAYTGELEKEVQHLLRENRKIKKKYEELLKQTMEAQIPMAKKRKLQRTASASF